MKSKPADQIKKSQLGLLASVKSFALIGVMKCVATEMNKKSRENYSKMYQSFSVWQVTSLHGLV